MVNYYSFSNAPSSIVTDLINSYMWTTTIWPRDILTAKNFEVQPASFASGNIVDRQMLSNANFYGTNLSHQANLFRSVYGKVYLDPKYSLMNRIFYESDLKVGTTNPAFKYTIFMMSDVEVRKLGYTYDTDHSQWAYTDPATPTVTTLSLNQDRLTRIADISVVNTPNGEFNDLSGTGIGETFDGEYVKFVNNKVYGSGNVVDGTSVTIDSSKTAFNGKVYYTKGLLHFAENSETLGQSIERLGMSSDPTVSARFNYFYQYMINSAPIYDTFLHNILGAPVGTFFTVFIPTNAAITQAVKAGLLPGNTTTGAPAFTAAGQTPQQQTDVANFILYHILNKNTVAVDGKKSGAYATLLNDINGNAKAVTVYYSNPSDPNTMEVRDSHYVSGQGATVNLAGSNNLANRALIHSINQVLNFN